MYLCMYYFFMSLSPPSFFPLLFRSLVLSSCMYVFRSVFLSFSISFVMYVFVEFVPSLVDFVRVFVVFIFR